MATKIFAYISPICREAPLGGICIKFCMPGPLADIINRAKFYFNQIRDFDSVGGSNFWLSHKKEKSPLTQGLNYRSACDLLLYAIQRLPRRYKLRQTQIISHPSAHLYCFSHSCKNKNIVCRLSIAILVVTSPKVIHFSNYILAVHVEKSCRNIF